MSNVTSIETVAAEPGWSGLFWEAFRQSRNAMVLLDDQRRVVDANGAYLRLVGYRHDALVGRPMREFLVGGPMLTSHEWHQFLRRRQFTGVTDLTCADGGRITTEFAGHAEVVTGRRLVLCVALRTTRRGRLRDPDGPQMKVAPLSDREFEVVQLIAAGLSGPEIADELVVAHNTVRTHVRNAMTKMGARSRAHLVAKAMGDGLLWRPA